MEWSLIGIALGHSRIQQAHNEKLQKELIAAIKDASRDREMVSLDLVPIEHTPEEEEAWQRKEADRKARWKARQERMFAEEAEQARKKADAEQKSGTICMVFTFVILLICVCAALLHLALKGSL